MTAKKILSLVCITSLIIACFTMMPVSADANVDLMEDDVLLLDAEEFSAMENKVELEEFIDSGGILVVLYDGTNNSNASDELGIPFSISQASSGEGIDVATLYYGYGDGQDGVYVINVVDENVSNTDVLINEAITEIKQRQIETANVVSTGYSVRSTTYSHKSLGTIDVTTTTRPKGKINARYKIYTLQDYEGEDFYFVEAIVTGYPGATLSASDSNYKEKYKGNELKVGISTSSSSVEIEDYGPERDVKTGSYTVDIGGSVSITPDDLEEIGLDLNFSTSWTEDIKDTTVSVDGSTILRTWTVDLNDSAREQLIRFHPGIVFRNSSVKSYIDIDLDVAFTIGGFLIWPEDIVIDRTVRCTGSDATLQ